MNEINILDKKTIDMIAAGEVVDRPSSVVKELLENAIDAGASSVSVEIKDGGTSLIRITDNGSGIEKDQIKKAFLRHSTSKIRNASDLSFISTLGFRGEALSSIAAVSKLELCTKTMDALTGTIYKINGGEEISMEEAGLPEGTTIIVRDLFYNTPARLKFLKTSQTEASYVYDVVEKIALSHADIAFKFINNGSVKLTTSGNDSLNDAIYSVFGRDVATSLYAIDSANDLISIKGFLGKPEISRSNRNLEIYFINGRYIKDKIIEKAIEEAYAGYQMKGTFPFTVFNLQIEPELIDVNVHPSKMEIRFFDNKIVFDSVCSMISEIIKGQEQISEIIISEDTPHPVEQGDNAAKREKGPEPFETNRNLEYNDISTVNTFQEEYSYTTEKNHPLRSEQKSDDNGHTNNYDYTSYKKINNESFQNTSETLEQGTFFTDDFLSKEARSRHRLIGDVFDTYWLVEYDDSFYIIDQHAAHEKVLYEELDKKLNEEGLYSQKIYPPVIITVSQREEDILLKCLKQFMIMGFEIEHYGGREYAISAAPSDLHGLNSRELFLSVLDELADINASDKPEILLDRLATASCKAAVKGGDKLSFREADELIDRLLKLDNPYNCPHGRPTMVKMSKRELEKKFKRII